jgi:hypothetical protein
VNDVVATYLQIGGGALLAACLVTFVYAAGGWRMVWELVNAVGAGSVAVSILHFQEGPSYLVLFFGWAMLAACLVSAGTVLQALFGSGSTHCVCPVCTGHRQQLGITT